MAIIINIDVMLAKRKMSVTELIPQEKELATWDETIKTAIQSLNCIAPLVCVMF